MKIDVRNYEINKHYHLEDEIDFSNHTFSSTYRIRKILSCRIKIDLVAFEDILEMKVEIKGEVVGACSYTDEDVNVKYHAKEDMTFSSDESRGADYYEPHPIFELDPYILALIDSSVPLSIHKKGAKMPESGNGYEVLSEEEYLARKKEDKGPSPFDVLDQIEFDEDDE